MRSTPDSEHELLFLDPMRCTGCRSCEVVCSYHHGKTFAPEMSSIRVFRDNKNGKISYVFKDTCDLCEGSDIPLCVSACAPRALCLKK
jgi:carbon-monoxide dehydrogenase iron sulfur subunit